MTESAVFSWEEELKGGKGTTRSTATMPSSSLHTALFAALGLTVVAVFVMVIVALIDAASLSKKAAALQKQATSLQAQVADLHTLVTGQEQDDASSLSLHDVSVESLSLPNGFVLSSSMQTIDGGVVPVLEVGNSNKKSLVTMSNMKATDVEATNISSTNAANFPGANVSVYAVTAEYGFQGPATSQNKPGPARILGDLVVTGSVTSNVPI